MPGTGGDGPHGPERNPPKKPLVVPPPPAPPAPRALPQPEMPPNGISKVYESNEEWSGEGKAFSRWYELASAPAPEGYVVHDDTFSLIGDRQENHKWCDWERVSKNESIVKWKFRMQGHDEEARLRLDSVTFGGHGDGSINFNFHVEKTKATSKGILIVTYRPK